MRKIIPIILLSTIFLSGCKSNDDQDDSSFAHKETSLESITDTTDFEKTDIPGSSSSYQSSIPYSDTTTDLNDSTQLPEQATNLTEAISTTTQITTYIVTTKLEKQTNLTNTTFESDETKYSNDYDEELDSDTSQFYHGEIIEGGIH